MRDAKNNGGFPTGAKALKVISLALALGEFTYSDLVARTGFDSNTVRVVVNRYLSDYVVVKGTGKAGGGRAPRIYELVKGDKRIGLAQRLREMLPPEEMETESYRQAQELLSKGDSMSTTDALNHLRIAEAEYIATYGEKPSPALARLKMLAANAYLTLSGVALPPVSARNWLEKAVKSIDETLRVFATIPCDIGLLQQQQAMISKFVSLSMRLGPSKSAPLVEFLRIPLQGYAGVEAIPSAIYSHGRETMPGVIHLRSEYATERTNEPYELGVNQ